MITFTFGHDNVTVGQPVTFEYRSDAEVYLAAEFELKPAEISELFHNGRITDPPDRHPRNWIQLKDNRSPRWVKDNDPDSIEYNNWLDTVSGDIIAIEAEPQPEPLTIAESIESFAHSICNFVGINLNEPKR